MFGTRPYTKFIACTKEELEDIIEYLLSDYKEQSIYYIYI